MPQRLLGPDDQPLVRRYFCSVGRRSAAERRHRARLRERRRQLHDRRRRGARRARAAQVARHRFAALRRSATRFRGSCSSGRTCWRRPASRRRRITCLPRRWSARGRAGIATFVMRGKEYLAAIFAEGGTLRAVTMRFAASFARRTTSACRQGAGPPRSGDSRSSARSPSSPRTSSTSGCSTTSTRAKLLELARVEARSREGRRRDRRGAARGRGGGPRTSSTSWRAQGAHGRRRARAGAGATGARAERCARAATRAEQDALADKSKKELYEQAKKLGLPGRSSMSRAELIAALRKAG